jgi:hypothetical protein
MGRLLCLTALLAAGLLGACGSGSEQPARPAPADSTQLTVEVTQAKPAAIRLELRCGGAQPCDQGRLARVRTMLRKAGNGSRVCTLQYGGPEHAHVTGTLEGRAVDVDVTRANGCGIADYEALFAALGRKPPLAR